MTKRDYKDYLEDIIAEIERVESFVANIKWDEFPKDTKTAYAVVRCLEIIGEAAKRIPDDIRAENSDIPWKQMAGMRDKLSHDYFGVDYSVVWETITNELPPLKEKLQALLSS